MNNLDQIDMDILRYVRDSGLPPSVLEIAKHIGRSGPTTWERLRNLADNKLVTYVPKRARSTQITEHGRQLLERYDNVSVDTSRFAA